MYRTLQEHGIDVPVHVFLERDEGVHNTVEVSIDILSLASLLPTDTLAGALGVR